MAEDLRKAAALIKAADAIILTNGAGLGVDSGLSTFRGRYQQDGDISPYAVAKETFYDDEPQAAGGYHCERYLEFTRATPHAGYHMMLDMCKDKPRGFAIFTSNIDSHWSRVLEERQLKPNALVEYHGSMADMQCHRNCKRFTWPSQGLGLSPDKTSVCPLCKRLARFNVCLIADNHFNDNKRKEEEQRWNSYLASLARSGAKVVVLEVGAGMGIPTVRRKSGEVTTSVPGAKLIRINLDDPELDSNVDLGYVSEDPDHVPIGGVGALEALTRIVHFVRL